MSSRLPRDSHERQAADAVYFTPWALGALAWGDVGAEAGAASVLAPRPHPRHGDPAVVDLCAAREQRRAQARAAAGAFAELLPDPLADERGGRVRVVIADDDHLFATGLKALLAHDERLEVVGYAANGDQAVSLAEILQPDLVLMDLHMPILGGLEAARQILARIECCIVVITSSDDAEDAVRARDIGVTAILAKSVGLHEIADRISGLASTIAPSAD